ncbi:hypothetical protein [Paraburkholderia sp. WP4_3_2]|uniref:hypothetical protein n=1 Tax=Paraburkholderia sp. WP4_3_2 TaxID=2587162 RepID=UPI00161B5E0F|nr:hypothetical protein [Paraburkholderia sp. WP4_3_2]MBB3261287.1 hypothetical protein [Paraburkholderia sp. WP4_3_2]
MERILFPGNMRQACEAWYGITFLKDDAAVRSAQIVVAQTDKINPGAMGTSLWNTDEGLNNLLNRILEKDLRGVRVEFVKFACILAVDGTLHSIELPIHLDIDDFIARGNRHDVTQAPAVGWLGTLKNAVGLGNKQYSFWSGDVVGGCARFYTNFEDRTTIDSTTARQWLDALNAPF